MLIEIRAVDKGNWNEVAKLKLAKDQQAFLPSNITSIAQSKVYPEHIPQAIYCDNELIGFVLHGVDLEGGKYIIFRFMIDKDRQKKGLGTKALNLLLGTLKASGRSTIYTSYEPENKVAQKFFTTAGFEETGELDHGEIISCIKL